MRSSYRGADEHLECIMKVMAIALLLACGSAVAADQSPVVELEKHPNLVYGVS